MHAYYNNLVCIFHIDSMSRISNWSFKLQRRLSDAKSTISEIGAILVYAGEKILRARKARLEFFVS
jgi:hypothetical protein